jgi:hypothetical protein
MSIPTVFIRAEAVTMSKRTWDTPKPATAFYLLFTLLLSSVIWSLIIWSGHLGMALGMMITSLMWCPALVALVTCRVIDAT